MLCRDCPKQDPEWAAKNQVTLRTYCCSDPMSTTMEPLVDWARDQVAETARMNRHERRKMQKLGKRQSA